MNIENPKMLAAKARLKAYRETQRAALAAAPPKPEEWALGFEVTLRFGNGHTMDEVLRVIRQSYSDRGLDFPSVGWEGVTIKVIEE